ncbi:hypothetical protein, partial [Ralstonia mannitolilytica]|uniref:hypothetical protein n=1 Tax=Ralstonia mannitolilytica TaxID=105219 RepID=UPI0029315913
DNADKDCGRYIGSGMGGYETPPIDFSEPIILGVRRLRTQTANTHQQLPNLNNKTYQTQTLVLRTSTRIMHSPTLKGWKQ